MFTGNGPMARHVNFSAAIKHDHDNRRDSNRTLLNDKDGGCIVSVSCTRGAGGGNVCYVRLRWLYWQHFDAARLLRVPPLTLVSYLTLLERHYRSHNSYHNSIHAADVVQSTFALLQHAALQVRY